MQEVAAAAKVSKNTVSLALRGSHLVAPATRDRVLDAVEEVGYKLNPALSKLMSEISLHPRQRRYASIAFFNYFSHPLNSDMHKPLQGFYQGALRQALAMGYEVQEYARPNSVVEKRRRDREIWAVGSDGILVFPFEEGYGDDDLSELALPKVTLGYTWAREDVSRVACDYFGNIVTLYHKLVGLGCRKIGLLVGEDMNQRTALRLTGGYFAAAAEASHRAPPGLTSSSDPAMIRGYIEKKKCDALLVSGSFHPQSLFLSHFKDLQKNLQVASYCLTKEQRNQGLAGIDENYEAAGEIAITLLAAHIQTPMVGSSRALSVRVPGTFFPGSSLH
jgi:LacI family transcriptional regulator